MRPLRRRMQMIFQDSVCGRSTAMMVEQILPSR